jgi:RNA polymerase sigma-70 factor (ECF subfamily)
MSQRPQRSATLRLVQADSEPPPEPVEALPSAVPELGLDALYRRHAAYVAGIATRLLGRDGDVDDLVQDVFVEALRGISKLREPGAIRGWLAKITVRLSLKRLRKQRLLRALRVEVDAGEYEQLVALSASPEQRALVVKVYRVLEQLPARTRVIWALRHVLEEPLHVIVELTACSQSTVQRTLREAERVLAQELHDE